MPEVATSPLDLSRAPPDVRVLSVADLKDALAKGVADFRANPPMSSFSCWSIPSPAC